MRIKRTFLRGSALGRFFASCVPRGFSEELGLGPAGPGDLSGGRSAPFVMTGPPGPETLINGRRYLYFGGTGYFGLQAHQDMVRAGVKAWRKYGMHSAASRTGFGNNPVLSDLEKRIAEYFGAGDSVYFASGYLSALFMAQGMAGRFDAVFVDENSHFSVLDGAFSARKPLLFYRHMDPSDLRARLRAELKPGQRPLVVTDGVFPAFGAIAPVRELARELEPYDGALCLDDAHGVGVLGENGRGTCEHSGLEPGGGVIMSGTLSKAFGGYGGFVPGTPELISRIRRTVGAYGGTNCVPVPVAAASAKGLELVRSHPEWRRKLRHNVARLRKGMKKLGFDTGDSPVPIVAWTLSGADEMKKVQAALLDRGIAVAYMKYSGTPDCGVLRASVFSSHTDAQIDRLLAELSGLV